MNLLTPTTHLGGFYKIEAFIPGNPPRVLADWFPNLITDYGMNLLGTANGNAINAIFSYCHVGTSSVAPSFSDTQLVAFKATANSMISNNYGEQTRTSDYVQIKKIWQFNQGVATGNLAEVGVGNSSRQLLSRALIKDSQGNPTTITVLPDEILQVSWVFRLYWPQNTVSGTIDIVGSGQHAFEIAACSTANNWVFSSGSLNFSPMGYCYVQKNITALLPITQNPNTSPSVSSSSNNYTLASYINNTFKATTTFTIPIGLGNFAEGISGFLFPVSTPNSNPVYQARFDPPIMKTASESLALTVSTTWARG